MLTIYLGIGLVYAVLSWFRLNTTPTEYAPTLMQEGIPEPLANPLWFLAIYTIVWPLFLAMDILKHVDR